MLDGTVGSSYFDRFNLKWKLSNDRNLRSVALQTFIREKEINYDRFCCLYWPRFSSQLTKNLDSSRVFTEIISHIKGGLQAGDFHDGKLNRDAYISMSEYRVSNISAEKRNGIYDIFRAYEEMKMERGEFDISDVVNDLHHRLKCHNLDGDKIDFVYIDEVQDLTMRQISLFKYICRNVEEGFVFSGDTAQTIARGIDFRFEDIRNLFYNEFVMDSKGDKAAKRKDKGHLSCVFQLLQNFRTHTGVLKLAQSVIDLLRHYFPQSVDVLKPETSLIDGAAPVLLKPGDDENAILTIFGNRGNNVGKIVGFGAEQVILVRDESAKKEIFGLIGQKALVLTIVECKGLEFQASLLLACCA
uniref:TPR and ankyrin repeat-containing protein 1-like n=1 Tax=Nicotiana tabacum TaxID=4097 RepID=A0A1S3Y632_TOBAC|nr:PREDICTED: TPR and ankyrin repeat-containing protein 1-like [Nicotiana tabacum]